MTIYTFSCGCTCIHDPFYWVSVRESDLVCPVHQDRELTQGNPDSLAFFSDVDIVAAES